MTPNPVTPIDRGGSALTPEELRVLACLIEKSHTTPDQYPMSTNALTSACNQSTSREPIVDYSSGLVDRTMQLLRDGGWARSVRGSGSRTFKHRHVIDERLDLDAAEQALVAVLALRGPQSPGELKTRTERYHRFADLDDVERVLDRLAGRQPPLVRDLGRQPGQSQSRWIQLIGPSTADGDGPAGATAAPATTPAPEPEGLTPSGGPDDGRPDDQRLGGDPPDEVTALDRRVSELERRLGALERELGIGS